MTDNKGPVLYIYFVRDKNIEDTTTPEGRNGLKVTIRTPRSDTGWGWFFATPRQVYPSVDRNHKTVAGHKNVLIGTAEQPKELHIVHNGKDESIGLSCQALKAENEAERNKARKEEKQEVADDSTLRLAQRLFGGSFVRAVLDDSFMPETADNKSTAVPSAGSATPEITDDDLPPFLRGVR